MFLARVPLNFFSFVLLPAELAATGCEAALERGMLWATVSLAPRLSTRRGAKKAAACEARGTDCWLAVDREARVLDLCPPAQKAPELHKTHGNRHSSHTMLNRKRA